MKRLHALFDMPGICRIVITQLVIFLLFWVGSAFTPSQHQFFYLDYLYLPFLFRLHWIVGMLVTPIMVLFDLYFSLDSAHGLSMVALLGLIREIPHAGIWGYQLAIFALGLFGLLVFFVARQYSRVSLRAATVTFMVLAVLYFPAKKLKWPLVSIGLTGPTFYAVVLQETFFFTRLNPGKMYFTPLNKPSWLAQTAKESPKILSILFESYGIDKTKPQINQYFENQLRQTLANRKIYSGLVSYSGSTVNGELRELCSVRTEGVVLNTVPIQYPCLPQQFAQKGYTTVAFHNHTGEVYDRSYWYPKIGFATFIDRTIMINKGYRPSQYAFAGIADKDIAKEISTWLDNHKKIFAHWITLDSHGPYIQPLAPQVVNCQKLAITEPMECYYVNTLQSTFSAIIAIAQRHPEVKIIISGDHAPHFETVYQPLVGKRLNALFDHQQVPALVIEPLE